MSWGWFTTVTRVQPANDSWVTNSTPRTKRDIVLACVDGATRIFAIETETIAFAGGVEGGTIRAGLAAGFLAVNLDGATAGFLVTGFGTGFAIGVGGALGFSIGGKGVPTGIER